MDVEVKKCPKCGNEINVNHYYPIWCEKCNWELYPHTNEPKQDVFERFYNFVGNKLGESLYNRMEKRGKRLPGISLSRILAYIVATAIYLTNAFFIILGIWALKFNIFITVILFVFAFLSFPRIKRVKKSPLPLNEFPTLYSVVNEIAQKLGSKSIDVLYLSLEFNASFTRAFMEKGFKMPRIITIGLPLFHILDEQEKVALIAHEVAHNVNNDSARGLYIGIAKNTLVEWYTTFSPRSEYGEYAVLISLVFFIPRLLILGVWYLLTFLLIRDSQISEYYADRLAAELSGSKAYSSMLRKLLNSYQYYFMWEKLNYDPRALIERLYYRVSNMPEKELERKRRLEKDKTSRIDATHPPTCYRIKYVEGLEYEDSKYKIDANDLHKIEKELMIF